MSDIPLRTNRVESMVGSRDGIRSGALWVDGHKRGFFHDRLTGVVRIFMFDAVRDRVEDRDEGRRAAAREMLEIVWDLELAGCPQDLPKPGGNSIRACSPHVDEARGAVL